MGRGGYQAKTIALLGITDYGPHEATPAQILDEVEFSGADSFTNSEEEEADQDSDQSYDEGPDWDRHSLEETEDYGDEPIAEAQLWEQDSQGEPVEEMVPEGPLNGELWTVVQREEYPVPIRKWQILGEWKSEYTEPGFPPEGGPEFGQTWEVVWTNVGHVAWAKIDDGKTWRGEPYYMQYLPSWDQLHIHQQPEVGDFWEVGREMPGIRSWHHCKSDSSTQFFRWEYLTQGQIPKLTTGHVFEVMAIHRNVIEWRHVMTNKRHLEETPTQLCGMGMESHLNLGVAIHGFETRALIDSGAREPSLTQALSYYTGSLPKSRQNATL